MHLTVHKLKHIQVVINCLYSIAQMCTREDMLAHNSGTPYFNDVMSYNSLTTKGTPSSTTGGHEESWPSILHLQMRKLKGT